MSKLINTITPVLASDAVQVKAAKVLAAIQEAQANQNGNTANNLLNAYTNGVNHGLFLAAEFIKTWFTEELTTVLIEDVPAQLPVKDWSMVPPHERPEFKLDSKLAWAKAYPEFNYKFE